MAKNFKEYLKIKWGLLSYRDKQMAIMSALKAASAIMEGSKIQPEELIEYTEKILEHFYQFDFLQKPSIEAETLKKVNKEFQKVKKNVPF